jgi:hypothetical protein
MDKFMPDVATISLISLQLPPFCELCLLTGHQPHQLPAAAAWLECVDAQHPVCYCVQVHRLVRTESLATLLGGNYWFVSWKNQPCKGW